MFKTIGFIGTGIMGAPMAMNLLKAGYRLQVWNRSRSKTEELVREGAVLCNSAAVAATGADMVISMLSDGPANTEVLFGSGGAVAAMSRGTILVVMSSIPMETAEEQFEQAKLSGIEYLDAPVSGGERGAIQGTLAIMAGGSEIMFERAKPVLQCMGRPVRVGEAGRGELAKLVNQLIVAGSITVIAEALLLAEHGGANPEKVREALTGGFADSPILQQHGLRMIEGNFKPGGSAKYQLKDTQAALGVAKQQHLKLPVAELVDSLYKAMVQHGDGELDHAGVIRELRRINGFDSIGFE